MSSKKIGTLTDEFCYYQDGQSNYINHHTGNEIHYSSLYEHYLSIEQNGNYQAKVHIVCEENNKKVASEVNPIMTSELGLPEYLTEHSLV